MKVSLIISLLFSLINVPVQSQSSTVKGKLIIFNSKFETGQVNFLNNALVEEVYGRANSDVTKVDGSFSLRLIGVTASHSVTLNVKKDGWEVVNRDRLTLVADQFESAKIFVSTIGRIAENKRKYYQIGKTEGEKVLERRLADAQNRLKSLSKVSSQNKDEIRLLNQEILRVNEEKLNLEKNSIELAERFAYTNLDETNERSVQAFHLYQKGQVLEAIKLLNLNDLDKDVLNFDSMNAKGELLIKTGESLQKVAKEGKSRLANDFLLGASLQLTLYNYSLANTYFQRAIDQDPQNLNILNSYSNFLIKQKMITEAIEINRKILSTVDTTFKLRAAVNLGNLYRLSHNQREAIILYREALKVSEELPEEKKSLYFKGIACNGLGMVHFELSMDNDSAKYFYSKAYEYKKSLLQLDSTADNYNELLKTSINLTAVYAEIGECEEGIGLGKRTVENYRRLVNSIKKEYLEYYGMAVQNLATNFKNCYKTQDAIDFLKEAIEIYDTLAKTNPGPYQPYIAMCYHNIGEAYLNINDYKSARRFLFDSYLIKKKYFEVYPDAYSLTLCGTMLDLAQANYGIILQGVTNRNDYFKEGLNFLKDAKQNIGKYSSNQKITLDNKINYWLGLYSKISE